jgi:hypothetical protein
MSVGSPYAQPATLAGRVRPGRRAIVVAAAIAAVAGLALWEAIEAGVKGPSAVPGVLRVVVVAVAFYAICGYALTRRLVPARLRPHWPLLVVPVGAMASGVLLTVLGFAYVPYKVSLGVTIAAGVVGGLLIHRRGGGPTADRADAPAERGIGRIAWPAYVAALIVAIFLIPVFRTGFVTVVGTGSDAHVAAGSATFLKHAYPSSTDVSLPLDHLPLTWRSKYPIYYSFAAVSSLAGVDSVKALAPLAALLAGLSTLGFFLVARYLLRAPPVGAVLAMALVGLNAMALLTVNNPYFNQTWGLVAMPFIVLFSYLALREPRAGTIALALLFTAVGAFAYPLMVAFPAAIFLVSALVILRERSKDGRPLDWRAPLRRLPRRAWLVPVYVIVLLLLAVPLLGVFEKVVSGLLAVLPGRSLKAWGGDILDVKPPYKFFSIPGPISPFVSAVAIAAVAAAAVAGVRRAERPLRFGLLAAMLVAGAFALYFSQRQFGQYFYFKVMAYLGPLVVTCAAVGLVALATRRDRRWLSIGATAAAGGYLALAAVAARDQTGVTFNQVTKGMLQVGNWDHRLPAGKSVRLDVEVGNQLWAGYFLADHPLSSARPLAGTAYPHVPYSRKADYILAFTRRPRPRDATNQIVFRNSEFTIWRMKRSVPGPDRSSRRMETEIAGVSLT